MIDETLVCTNLPFENKSRKVRVYVPAHEEGETFPVIYMTDGQNLFDEESSSFGCWYTREAVRDERENSGHAAIIVGVHNDGEMMERTNELTPASIGKIVYTGDIPKEAVKLFKPQGETFDNFIINTVMPAIEARFPVEKGRNATAFCGSSSGGLQSFFTAMSHPDGFCAAGVFSPAFLFYAPEDIQSWINGRLQADMPYLYFYCGCGDPLEEILCRYTERVYDMLTECYDPEKLNEVILADQRHNESAWAMMFKDFLHTFLTRREDF